MNYDKINPRPRIRMRATGPSHASPNVPSGLRVVADPVTHPDAPKRKRRPNQTSWVPRQSGNPNGRPAGAKGFKATARKVFMEPVEVQPGKKMPLFEALLRQEAQSAAKGDWRARATMFALSRWILGSEPDPEALVKADPDMSATGKAILEWFADEVRLEQTSHSKPDDKI